MSLNIYTKKEDVPHGIEIIKLNDTFFDQQKLNNNTLTQKILSSIDLATYNSDQTFIGRDKSLGALNKENLSTGTKTLLNIAYNPDKCFNVLECGQNALELLAVIDNGHVLWERPILVLDDDIPCDINTHNKHFSNLLDVMDELMKNDEDDYYED